MQLKMNLEKTNKQTKNQRSCHIWRCLGDGCKETQCSSELDLLPGTNATHPWDLCYWLFPRGRWSSSRIVTADDLVFMGGQYSFPRMMLLPALSFCHCIHIFFFVLLTSPLAMTCMNFHIQLRTTKKKTREEIPNNPITICLKAAEPISRNSEKKNPLSWAWQVEFANLWGW